MGLISRVSSRTYRYLVLYKNDKMNAKIIKLEFDSTFPDLNHAKEALTVLTHTILFHRSTGNFQYREGSNSKFSIEPVGLLDDELNFIRLSNDINGNNINIRYPFMRMNCEQLDKFIKQELNNRIINCNSNQFYISFYQNSGDNNSRLFKTENNSRVWEQYHISFEIDNGFEEKNENEFENQFVCDHEINSDTSINSGNYPNFDNSGDYEKQQLSKDQLSGILGQQLASLCSKVIREISVNQSYVPPLPQEKSQLGTVFSTRFRACQPYLFKFASSKEELAYSGGQSGAESPVFDDVVESSPGRVGSGVRSGSANLNRNNSGRSSGRNRGGGGGGFDLINVTKKFTNHLFFSK